MIYLDKGVNGKVISISKKFKRKTFHLQGSLQIKRRKVICLRCILNKSSRERFICLSLWQIGQCLLFLDWPLGKYVKFLTSRLMWFLLLYLCEFQQCLERVLGVTIPLRIYVASSCRRIRVLGLEQWAYSPIITKIIILWDSQEIVGLYSRSSLLYIENVKTTSLPHSASCTWSCRHHKRFIDPCVQTKTNVSDDQWDIGDLLARSN